MATSTLKGSYDEDEDGELEASSLVCRALLGFVAIVASLSFFFFWWGITRYNSPTGFSLLEVLFFCRQQPLITAKWQPMCRTLHLLHCPYLSCVRSSLNCAAQIPRRKVPKKMFCSVWHCIIIILIMPHLIVRIIYVGVCETFTGHTNSDKWDCQWRGCCVIWHPNENVLEKCKLQYSTSTSRATHCASQHHTHHRLRAHFHINSIVIRMQT